MSRPSQVLPPIVEISVGVEVAVLEGDRLTDILWVAHVESRRVRETGRTWRLEIDQADVATVVTAVEAMHGFCKVTEAGR